MSAPSGFAEALAGRYRVERELGRGGMATVYLAQDLRHDRKVAIKVLNAELAAWFGAERFLAEIRTTARLQHPHILPLLDSGEVDGRPYCVMPYVAGETLRSRLERERLLPVDDAVRITKEVADALAHAHAHGIIHRDIKPENILLGTPAPGSSVAPSLVADFGVARSVDDAGGRLTSTGVTVGTAAYMSPEQATAERDLDARSDVYSLGCVLYEMLAGEPPFTGPNARTILARQLSEPARPVGRLRRGVPAHVDAAIETALRREPADRFPDATAFTSALDAGRATGVTGRFTLRRARGATRRISSKIIVGGIAAAAGIGVAAWALVSRPNPAIGMADVRIQRFTPNSGDTASAYLAATLQQDVMAALAGSGAVRVFATDSARLRTGYALSARAARLADSARITLTVLRDPEGEFVGTRSVSLPVERLHELSGLATDAVLDLIRRRRRDRAAAGAPPTRDSIAYDLFLRGRFQTDRRTEAGTQRAVALFSAAVTRDTTFAEGWAGLARALQQANVRRYRIAGLERDSIPGRMLEASQRALDADSARSYVWLARGIALREVEPAERRNAIAAFERAIRLDSSNADAWHYLAVTWDDSLQPARALAAWRRVLRIDPTHRQALGFLAQHYIWMRQYDSAVAWGDSGRHIDPTHVFPRQMMGRALMLRGDTAAAAEQFRTLLRLADGPDEAEAWVGLAELAARGHDRLAADTLLARAVAVMDTLRPAVHDAAYLGWGYAVLGDTARALRMLERYTPRADVHFQLHLQCDPTLDALRASSRFRALLVRAPTGCRR